MAHNEQQLKVSYRTALRDGNKSEASKFANMLGNLLLNNQKYVEAEKFLLIDYNISRESGDKKDLLDSLHSLGNVYFCKKAYKAAEEYMLKHLELSIELHDDRDRQRAYTQLGRLYTELYTNTAEFDSLKDAKKYTNLALDLAEELCKRGKYAEELADAYNNIGQLMLDIDNYTEAKTLLQQGLDVCNNNELTGGVKSRLHFNLSRAHQAFFDETQALEHNRQDILICKENNLTFDLAKAYMEEGNIYLSSLKDDKTEDYKKAERAYKNAQREADKLEDEIDFQESCSVNFDTLKNARLMWEEFDELSGQQRAFKRRCDIAAIEGDGTEKMTMLKEYAKILNKRVELAYLMKAWNKMVEMSKLLMEAAMELNDTSLQDLALLNVAQAYSEQREWDKATIHYMQAFKQCTQHDDTEGRSAAKAGLGNIEDYQGRYMDALHLYEEAYEIAMEKGEENCCQQQLQAAENIHYICLVRMTDKRKTRMAEKRILEVKKRLRRAREAQERQLQAQAVDESRAKNTLPDCQGGEPVATYSNRAGEQAQKTLARGSIPAGIRASDSIYCKQPVGLSRGREVVQNARRANRGGQRTVLDAGHGHNEDAGKVMDSEDEDEESEEEDGSEEAMGMRKGEVRAEPEAASLGKNNVAGEVNHPMNESLDYNLGSSSEDTPLEDSEEPPERIEISQAQKRKGRVVESDDEDQEGTEPIPSITHAEGGPLQELRRTIPLVQKVKQEPVSTNHTSVQVTTCEESDDKENRPPNSLSCQEGHSNTQSGLVPPPDAALHPSKRLKVAAENLSNAGRALGSQLPPVQVHELKSAGSPQTVAPAPVSASNSTAQGSIRERLAAKTVNLSKQHSIPAARSPSAQQRQLTFPDDVSPDQQLGGRAIRKEGDTGIQENKNPCMKEASDQRRSAEQGADSVDKSEGKQETTSHSHTILIEVQERIMRVHLEDADIEGNTVGWLAERAGLTYFKQNPLGNGWPGLLLSHSGMVLDSDEPLQDCLPIMESSAHLKGEIIGWTPHSDCTLGVLYMVSCYAANQKVRKDLLDSLTDSEKLVVVNSDLHDKDAKPLIWAVGRSNIAPTEINLSHNNLQTPTMQTIVMVMNTLKQESLSLRMDLHCNRLGLSAISLLCGSPIMMLRLEALDLSHNALGDEGSRVVGNLLRKATELRKVALEGCGLGERTMVAAATAFTAGAPLTSLRLGGNDYVPSPAWVALFRRLLQLQRLTELDLTNSKLDSKAIQALSAMVKAHPSLAALHLGSNPIDEEGGAALAEALVSRSAELSLSLVDLSHCHMSPQGAEVLCSSLMKLEGLTSLELSGNLLSPKAMKIISAALQHGIPPLKHLHLSGCGLGLEGTLSVLESLAGNAHLRSLSLAANFSLATNPAELLDKSGAEVGGPHALDRNAVDPVPGPTAKDAEIAAMMMQGQCLEKHLGTHSAAANQTRTPGVSHGNPPAAAGAVDHATEDSEETEIAEDSENEEEFQSGPAPKASLGASEDPKVSREKPRSLPQRGFQTEGECASGVRADENTVRENLRSGAIKGNQAGMQRRVLPCNATAQLESRPGEPAMLREDCSGASQRGNGLGKGPEDGEATAGAHSILKKACFNRSCRIHQAGHADHTSDQTRERSCGTQAFNSGIRRPKDGQPIENQWDPGSRCILTRANRKEHGNEQKQSFALRDCQFCCTKAALWNRAVSNCLEDHRAAGNTEGSSCCVSTAEAWSSIQHALEKLAQAVSRAKGLLVLDVSMNGLETGHARQLEAAWGQHPH